MKIKICASVKEKFPTPGPYKTIDTIERESPYHVGDVTHYGEVILLLPSVLWANDDVEQVLSWNSIRPPWVGGVPKA
jgi:hypothetical protein